VIELAKRRGIEVDERAFFPEKLSSFSGRCQTGSTADVTPVSEIGPY
jgi:branched-chain amino acid aminotransferase